MTGHLLSTPFPHLGERAASLYASMYSRPSELQPPGCAIKKTTSKGACVAASRRYQEILTLTEVLSYVE
jgi:hypothetical protein